MRRCRGRDRLPHDATAYVLVEIAPCGPSRAGGAGAAEGDVSKFLIELAAARGLGRGAHIGQELVERRAL